MSGGGAGKAGRAVSNRIHESHVQGQRHWLATGLIHYPLILGLTTIRQAPDSTTKGSARAYGPTPDRTRPHSTELALETRACARPYPYSQGVVRAKYDGNNFNPTSQN